VISFNQYIAEQKELEELTTPQLFAKVKSQTVSRKKYAAAAELVKQIYDRKKKETGGKPKHGLGWYADAVARQIPGVDTRTLVNMMQDKDMIKEEAEYQGKKVKLNDPFRSSDGKKKFYVYVKNEKGNVIKLGFGDPNMEIKRDDPERRKSYRARHNCDNPGPKWKANYWSCKMWSSTNVSELD
jgi:hypothetical protein